MQRLCFVCALLVLLAVPAVAAAGPGGGPTYHDHDTFTDVDPDFCGTGETVLVAGRFNVSGWIGETGGDPGQELKTVFSYGVTLTNPDNGTSIIDSGAGSFTNVIVEGLESGPHTHVFVENGLRAKLKLANGRVLTHDAGSLTYSASFDAADNFLGIEIISVHGPHDAFQSPLWCDVATEALGIG